MIALSQLLQAADVQPSDGRTGIPAVLGDSYLYVKNPICRDIRDKAIAFSYSFSDQDCGLWRDYQVLPLVTLPHILTSRMIPFIDNISILARLMENKTDLAVPPHFLLTALKKNYLLHESGHAVSYAILERQNGSLLDGWSEGERFVVEAFLCESFANTMEKIASAMAWDKMHALFFTLNSYIIYNREHIERVRDALRVFGAKAVFALGFVLFYASNTSRGTAIAFDRDRALETLVKNRYLPSVQDADALCNQLMGSGFTVNPDFRDETTPLYFEICGQGECVKNNLQGFGIDSQRNNLDLVFRAVQVFGDAEATALADVDETLRRVQ